MMTRSMPFAGLSRTLKKSSRTLESSSAARDTTRRWMVRAQTFRGDDAKWRARAIDEPSRVGVAARRKQPTTSAKRSAFRPRLGIREAHAYGFSCARISPSLCASLWTLTYRLPALSSSYWASLNLAPAGTTNSLSDFFSRGITTGPFLPAAPA